MKIILGSEKDIVMAHQLMLEAFEEYRTLEVPSSAISEPVEKLRDAFKAGSEKFLICYLDGRPCGSVRFSLKEDALYFSRLSVPPCARGKGLAKSMLAWLEDYARKERKNKMECRVRLTLVNNGRLYKNLGYVVTKEETVVNPNGYQVQTVVMEKTLN